MSKLEAILLSETVVRLVLAAVLGGLVGIERQFHRKPAGLRTIMFITFGAALFTVISEVTATMKGGDPQRIAAQIIPGIGFLGAGAILRERGTVIGLTTAATIFVVASMGMAVGGGLYWTSIYICLLVLMLLVVVGWMEDFLSLKTRRMLFRLTAQNLETTLSVANLAFAEESVPIQHFQVLHLAEDFVLEFEVDVSLHQQKRLASKISLLGTKFEVVPREYVTTSALA